MTEETVNSIKKFNIKLIENSKIRLEYLSTVGRFTKSFIVYYEEESKNDTNE